MNLLSGFLGSLLLTLVVSFFAPLTLVGALVMGLLMLSYVPAFQAMSESAAILMFEFLRVFGAGNLLHGVLLLGIVSSLVGVLFNTFNFYRYQNLRSGH